MKLNKEQLKRFLDAGDEQNLYFSFGTWEIEESNDLPSEGLCLKGRDGDARLAIKELDFARIFTRSIGDYSGLGWEQLENSEICNIVFRRVINILFEPIGVFFDKIAKIDKICNQGNKQREWFHVFNENASATFLCHIPNSEQRTEEPSIVIDKERSQFRGFVFGENLLQIPFEEFKTKIQEDPLPIQFMALSALQSSEYFGYYLRNYDPEFLWQFCFFLGCQDSANAAVLWEIESHIGKKFGIPPLILDYDQAFRYDYFSGIDSALRILKSMQEFNSEGIKLLHENEPEFHDHLISSL